MRCNILVSILLVLLPVGCDGRNFKTNKIVFKYGMEKHKYGPNKRKLASLGIIPKLELLRPIVTCMGKAYMGRKRLGKGFSHAELKEAGLTMQFAKAIGIACDPKRRNRSIESLLTNAGLLKTFLAEKAKVFTGQAKGKEHGEKEEAPLADKLVDKVVDNLLDRAFTLLSSSREAGLHEDLDQAMLGKPSLQSEPIST